MSVKTYIALGSNLNNPRAQINTALTALAALPQSELISTSSLYRNKPLGPQDQDDFINAVVCLTTTLAATTLLASLLAIEQQQGRMRTIRYGPRNIDLDLLLYGKTQINLPELTVPHPGLYERNFVLYPLAEIAPELRLPNGKSVTQWLAESDLEKLVASD